MNPFKYRYNLTDVSTGTTFPVDLSLTRGSWFKILILTLAPFAVLLGLTKVAELTSEKKPSYTEDTLSHFPQYN